MTLQQLREKYATALAQPYPQFGGMGLQGNSGFYNIPPDYYERIAETRQEWERDREMDRRAIEIIDILIETKEAE